MSLAAEWNQRIGCLIIRIGNPVGESYEASLACVDIGATSSSVPLEEGSRRQAKIEHTKSSVLKGELSQFSWFSKLLPFE